jgi:thymidylate synthase (FAD)
MQVALVALTQFVDAGAFSSDWQPDPEVSDGENLIEASGRSCYASWTRPNPATATNAGYIRHILEVGHFSVLEHASATFWLTGVSRSFTHELVRSRHLSYSQESQRYVKSGGGMVTPPLFDGDPVAEGILQSAELAAVTIYQRLASRAEEILATRDLPATDRKKQARQAARAVLPNMTETKIVVTGNFRALRHFIDLRATAGADVEIRAVAVAMLRELQRVAPNVFADYTISQLDDGTEVALSLYAERS